MELYQLQCFQTAAKTQHMTQAAELLHITQPALSKNISRLEEDLGVRLFDREGKTIRLNECGLVVQRYAEQLLNGIGDMRAELAEMAAGEAGRIRIGSCFPSQEPNWLLGLIRAFALERPDVSFSLMQYSSRSLATALENRVIDIAISSVPIRSPVITWEELFVENMGIILSANHPLAAKEVISMADLQAERFYCNNANSDVLDLTHYFCAQAGFVPNIHFEGEFPSFIGEAVSRGHGISVISRRGYLRSSSNPDPAPWEANITYRPLKESYCQRVCGLAYLTSRSLSYTMKAFFQSLHQSIQEAE